MCSGVWVFRCVQGFVRAQKALGPELKNTLGESTHTSPLVEGPRDPGKRRGEVGRKGSVWLVTQTPCELRVGCKC